jgi:hypothetical protein
MLKKLSCQYLLLVQYQMAENYHAIIDIFILFIYLICQKVESILIILIQLI